MKSFASAIEIGDLADLDLPALRQHWRELYGSEPPVRMSRELMIQAMAYRIQENMFGGLSRTARLKLAEAGERAGSAASSSSRREPKHRIKPGTRFLREWQGQTYESDRDSGRALPLSGQHLPVPQRDRSPNHRHPLVRAGLLRPEATCGEAGVTRRRPPPQPQPGRKLRCAIYTRKSSEEGLEQSFNSLHAQRDACEAFITSQKHEGWTLLPAAYDDGGLSGGSIERPALQRLLADVQSRLVDIVVVYKVDRLTRSLADFAKLTELFEAHETSFVSVTQQFNTSTSMGRLTLNVLLSFAQFEREVAGERSVTRSPSPSAAVCGWEACRHSAMTASTESWR